MKRLASLVLILSLTAGAAGAAGSAGATGAAGSAGQESSRQKPAKTPPDNLARIRDAVNRPTVLRVENGQLRIYVEVIGNWPSFAEMSKGYDLMQGPTGRDNAIGHQELFATTAPQMYSSGGGIKAGEALTMAVVGYVGQWAILKGLRAISKARSEKELRDIREQIDRELAAIKREK